MKRLVSPLSVVAACGLIVVTNLAILAAAGWNRRGEGQAELLLTERELALPTARQDKGAGFELSLVTTNEPPGEIRRTAHWKGYELPSVPLDWLDGTKLRELGFRVTIDPAHPDAAEYYLQVMPRRVFIVVEYDGTAWQQWLTDREDQVRILRSEVEEGRAEPSALADAEALLEVDRIRRSRLFPVDAGLDADALQRRYGDRRRHAIVSGLLRPKVVDTEYGGPVLSGEVQSLVVSRVYISYEIRRQLETFMPEETWQEIETRERREAEMGWPPPIPPRYHATLAVGHRHEPWLVSVDTLTPRDSR
jgi:hypothetical protein